MTTELSLSLSPPPLSLSLPLPPSHSSLAAKMEYLTELQKHLESSLHESHSGDSKPASGNTSYTAYYFMRGEDGEPLVAGEGEEERGGERTPRKSSTPKKSSPKTPPKCHRRGSREGTPWGESQAQINSLQSELEEVRRWNEALQTRLKESGRTRDVGVGMEKGGEAAPVQAEDSFAPEKYLELEADVDRLLAELEAEREQSQGEKEQQENECAALQGELAAAEERVMELESQLKETVLHDGSSSSLESGHLAGLREEVESLHQTVSEAEATIAGLRVWLQAEREDNQRLRGRLTELGGETSQRASPPVAELPSTSARLLPHLPPTPDCTPGRATADSWTSPGVALPGQQAEGIDVRALKERHEAVTQLNRELQRKCREQLHRSPPGAHAGRSGAAASSGGGAQSTSTWQVYCVY